MTADRFNFRVWDKENKCFSTGLLLTRKGVLKEVDFEEGIITTVNQTNYELMQSTGLVDRNGKEIYEGDIIEFSTFKVVVKWEDCRFKIKSSCCDLALDIIRAEQCEVLGNIYENKELLGE